MTQEQDGPGHCDLSILFEAATRDLVTFRRLSALFLDMLPQMRDRLAQALRENDRQQIARTSHALKGTTGLVGATRLTSMLAEMEALYASDGGEECSELFLDELWMLMEAAKQEVQLGMTTFDGKR